MVGIDTVVVSIMHSADFPIEALRKYVRENVIAPVLERYGFHAENVAISTSTPPAISSSAAPTAIPA